MHHDLKIYFKLRFLLALPYGAIFPPFIIAIIKKFSRKSIIMNTFFSKNVGATNNFGNQK